MHSEESDTIFRAVAIAHVMDSADAAAAEWRWWPEAGCGSWGIRLGSLSWELLRLLSSPDMRPTPESLQSKRRYAMLSHTSNAAYGNRLLLLSHSSLIVLFPRWEGDKGLHMAVRLMPMHGGTAHGCQTFANAWGDCY